MPNLIPPSATSNALVSSVEKPCGALCFVRGGVSSSIASTTIRRFFANRSDEDPALRMDSHYHVHPRFDCVHPVAQLHHLRLRGVPACFTLEYDCWFERCRKK